MGKGSFQNRNPPYQPFKDKNKLTANTNKEISIAHSLVPHCEHKLIQMYIFYTIKIRDTYNFISFFLPPSVPS